MESTYKYLSFKIEYAIVFLRKILLIHIFFLIFTNMNYENFICVWIADSKSKEFAKEYFRLNGYNLVDHRDIEFYDSIVDAYIIEVESDVEKHIKILSDLIYVSGVEKYDHNYTILCHEIKEIKNILDEIENEYSLKIKTDQDYINKINQIQNIIIEKFSKLKDLK